MSIANAVIFLCGFYAPKGCNRYFESQVVSA
jgi:hypothetical protein